MRICQNLVFLFAAISMACNTVEARRWLRLSGLGVPDRCKRTEDCPQDTGRALTCNAGGMCVPAPDKDTQPDAKEAKTKEPGAKETETEETETKEPEIASLVPAPEEEEEEDPVVSKTAPPTDVPLPAKCREASDCPSRDYECQQGYCVEAKVDEYFKCNLDSDCPSKDYECLEGKCALIDKERICGPTICPSDLVCCNASCGICTEPGMMCTQQVCEEPTSSYSKCKEDADCTNKDEICEEGLCVVVTVLEPVPEDERECYEDTNCPEKECSWEGCGYNKCIDYKCVYVLPCKDVSDCPMMACIDGMSCPQYQCINSICIQEDP